MIYTMPEGGGSCHPQFLCPSQKTYPRKLGLLLSGPLTVVLMTLVQLLYLEDVLEDSAEKQ